MKTLFKPFILIIFSFFLFQACDKNSSGPDDEHHHFEAIGLYVIQSGDTIVSYVGGTVTGAIDVAAGADTPLLYLKFIAEDGDIGVPEGDEYSLSWEIEHTTIAGVHQHEGEDWELHIEGKTVGQTTITFSILHNDHEDFVSKAINIQVTGNGKQESTTKIIPLKRNRK